MTTSTDAPPVAGRQTASGAVKPQKEYHEFLLSDFAEHLGISRTALIENTAMQFFYDDNFFKDVAERREKAEALINTALLPMNRQHALMNIAGHIGVADFKSLTLPLSYDPRIDRVWTPKTMPDVHSMTDFKVRYENRYHTVLHKGEWQKREITELWRKWEYRRVYMGGPLFAPGMDQRNLPDNYNIWRGWGIDVGLSTPHRPEAWATLRKHFEEAYFQGDKKVEAWFYSWLSDIFTNPACKPSSSLVLRGLKGTGKSLLPDIMSKLVGLRHYSRLDKPSQLTGQFNGHLLPVLLANIEEAFFSGDRAAENTLKSWISSEDVHIRLMRTDGFQAKNFTRFLFTSNNDWVVPVTADERRYLVIDVSDKFKGDDAHFSALWDELKHTDGFAEFFKFLLTWEKPKGVRLNDPPKTEALARQFEESLSIPERFFWNAVKTGDNFPCEEGGTFYRSETQQLFQEWCRDNNEKYATTNDKLFTSLMEKYWMAEKVGRTAVSRTKKETVYRVSPLGEIRTTLMEKWDLHAEAFDCDDDEEE